MGDLLKKIFGLLLVLFFCSFVFSSSIVRDLPESIAPSQEFTVSLVVNVSNEDSFYGIEEYLPSGFVLVSAPLGDVSLNNQVKWLEINALPGEKIISYTLRAPAVAGEYSFDGQFLFETQSNPLKVLGDSKIMVAEQPMYPLIFYAALIILVLVVTIYVLLNRKKVKGNREVKTEVKVKKRKK